MQGARDSALTPLGQAQCAAMGALLASLGVGPSTHAALVSPQGRAAASARLALAPLGFLPRADPRLAEVQVGAWTGLLLTDIAAGWPGSPGETLLAFYARCPDGEPLAELSARVGALVRDLRGPTVLVSHGVTLRVLSALALGLPLEAANGLPCPQGSLVRIRDGRREVLTPPASDRPSGPGLPGLARAGQAG